MIRKKELVVKWTPYIDGITQNITACGALIAFSQPQPLIKAVADECSGLEFMKCPAFTEVCANSYVIHAPFDITLNFLRRDNGTYSLTVPNVSQQVLNAFFFYREDGVLTLPPRYILYCDESLVMEVAPVPALASIQNTLALIPGAYDIGKWIRPVEFAVRVLNFDDPIIIRRGDALFCIKFRPSNKQVVRLERVFLTQELLQVVNACTNVKQYIHRQPLTTLYKLAAPLLRALKILRSSK